MRIVRRSDSVTQATAVLTAHGFKIAKVSSVHSNAILKGTVTGTSPSGRAAKGSAVTVLVSAGPFTSVVPSVHGDKLPAAEAALQRAHLTYSVDRVGSDAAVGTAPAFRRLPDGRGAHWLSSTRPEPLFA